MRRESKVGVVVTLAVLLVAGLDLSGVYPLFPEGTKGEVAIVVPTFTRAAYSQGGFYAFYAASANLTGPIRSNLGMLSLDLGALGLLSNLSSPYSPYVNQSQAILGDQQVDAGALFGPGGRRAFDRAVIGHEEYVTRAEYLSFRQFVASGGTLVSMDGNEFYTEVNYSQATHMVTLIAGHGYEFNGTVAHHSDVKPFRADNIDWAGSDYCCIARGTGAYVNSSDPIGHYLQLRYGQLAFTSSGGRAEYNSLFNRTGTSVIATWIGTFSSPVYAYTHRYRQGLFVSFGGYGDALIAGSPSTQYFLQLALGKDLK